MVIAIREKPLKLIWLEAVMRRLLKDDVEFHYYQEQYRRLDAGFAGEQKVDREWHELLCPNTFFVLHNLCLKNTAQHMHQLDTLFICPQFIFVLEIKNIHGRLEFNQLTHQCTRTKADGTVEGFPNAFTQTERHIRFLKSLSYSLPIEGAVVIANPSAIIVNPSKVLPIFHVSGLHQHLQSLFKKHPQKMLTDDQLAQLVQGLLSKQTIPHIRTSIAPSRFRHGVLCPKCSYQHNMYFYRGIWKCSFCHYRSIEIFAEAMLDYQLLVSHSITNQQLRKFFKIDSIDTATRLLQKFQFPYTGTYKNRVYHLPENLLDYMKRFF
ncbi:nuclease-related domain-containing protein [Lysinibacillus sphaericus]|uniref:nuclease-related domain-containing protein n=1 Tax=Lysinibacillus sphaericus TaxID=1421 RepID=UPI000B17A845|nr:nuclease-related domain-containing protein [Lysinibacillus sphaericus]